MTKPVHIYLNRMKCMTTTKPSHLVNLNKEHFPSFSMIITLYLIKLNKKALKNPVKSKQYYNNIVADNKSKRIKVDL